MPYAVLKTYRSRIERIDFLWQEFGPLLKDGVLDVGCGDALLRQHVSRYVGIDITGHPDVRLDLESIERLPFNDNAFNAVICIDVLEHLDRLHFFFDELVRVSQRYVIISLPNMLHWGHRLIYLRGRTSEREYGLQPFNRHKWFFSYLQARDYVCQRLGPELRLYREIAVPSTRLACWKPGSLLLRRFPNLFAIAYWACIEKIARIA